MLADSSYWQCIQHESDLLSEAAFHNYFRRTLPRGVFAPGDFAFHKGNINDVFNEMLKTKGHSLYPGEERVFPAHGRYCVVLDRVGRDKYVICYLTTFNGATDYQTVTGPIAQFFGLPLGGMTFWPNVSPLQTYPPWKPGAYIMGIPVIREGLESSNLNTRFRLFPSELKRMKDLIQERFHVCLMIQCNFLFY